MSSLQRIEGSEPPVLVISGASRGIGAAVARTMLERGWRVSLGARKPGELASIFGPENDRAAYFRFDAEDRESARGWIDDTISRFGRIDALVNNAGSNEKVKITDDNDEALDRLWAVNVKAPLRLTRLCLPYLEACGNGRIVNVASLSGKRVRNEWVGYSMTKFALMGLTHTTRHIAWEKGVRATAICPSFVRTDMTAAVTKVRREEMIPVQTLADLIRTIIELPNTAAIAELLVNCRLEDML
jgi:NAD(P)-dependent dehydrogenase (short-subunit alcohol dehydrogenase family)